MPPGFVRRHFHETGIATLKTRAHSFPRAAEFRAEPRNLAVAAEFHGIPRKHGNCVATAKFRKSVLLL